MTADLVTWLRAQLDEDERVAEAALARTRRWPKGDRPWERAALRAELDPGSATVLDRMATFGDPARLLAEVAAKRRILAIHGMYHECADPWEEEDGSLTKHTGLYRDDDPPCPTLVALSEPYAGRDGWRAEWAT